MTTPAFSAGPSALHPRLGPDEPRGHQGQHESVLSDTCPAYHAGVLREPSRSSRGLNAGSNDSIAGHHNATRYRAAREIVGQPIGGRGRGSSQVGCETGGRETARRWRSPFLLAVPWLLSWAGRPQLFQAPESGSQTDAMRTFVGRGDRSRPANPHRVAPRGDLRPGGGVPRRSNYSRCSPRCPIRWSCSTAEPVTSPEQWFRRRRPELKALFQHYMYGQMPPRPGSRDLRDRAGGPRLPRRQGDPEGSDHHLRPARGPEDPPAAGRPERAEGRPPRPSSGSNFHGNHAVVDDPKVAPADGVDAESCARGQGQPGDRRRPGHGGRRLGGRGGDRPGLRAGDVLLRRRRPRPPRASPTGSSPTTSSPARRSRARTTGGRSPPGPGGCRGRSITSRPTRTSTPAGSPSSATRGWARPRSSPPRSTSGSRW